MKLTKEEIYELNQMLDERMCRFWDRVSHFWLGIDKMPTTDEKAKICTDFITLSTKEYDTINTIRAKINKKRNYSKSRM